MNKQKIIQKLITAECIKNKKEEIEDINEAYNIIQEIERTENTVVVYCISGDVESCAYLEASYYSDKLEHYVILDTDVDYDDIEQLVGEFIRLEKQARIRETVLMNQKAATKLRPLYDKLKTNKKLELYEKGQYNILKPLFEFKKGE